MSELPQLASAMLTVAFAAVMLVAGQLYLEHISTRMGRTTPALQVPTILEANSSNTRPSP
jgi:hypothetical protein